MNRKINKLQEELNRTGLDALLVAEGSNIRYLTDFPAQESWLVVTQSAAVYLTDFRYEQEARNGLRGIDICIYGADRFGELSRQLSLRKCRKTGFDENHVSVAEGNRLKDKCPHISWTAANGLVEKLRVTKSSEEIANIRVSLDVHRLALRYLARILKPGKTEREVALKLEAFVKRRGCEFSFTPIIASGPNSSFPHASVTDRLIKANDIVLVDFGIDHDGYKSDLTRMFFFGNMSSKMRQHNDLVLKAQHRAIAVIAPGVSVSQADRAARDTLAQADLDRFFGHALGHGVGLDIHEAPRLSQKSADVFTPGMVVTVEPAVYFNDQYGIRIEDMVLVTDEGREVLSEHID